MFSPGTLAGTPEAPEVTDPAGDCEFAPGNQYMDVVAAWISDETPNDLNVNIQLASWTPVVSEGAGFTLQFRHQGVRFGVLAGFIAQTWTYGNGEVNEEGEIISFNDTTGPCRGRPRGPALWP